MINEIIENVLDEIERQDEKWGDQAGHPILLWNAILGEEAGEVAKASLENEFKPNFNELDAELIQVAAVAIQFARAVRIKQFTHTLEQAGYWLPEERDERT